MATLAAARAAKRSQPRLVTPTTAGSSSTSRTFGQRLSSSRPSSSTGTAKPDGVLAMRRHAVVPEPPIGWLLHTARHLLANHRRGRRRYLGMVGRFAHDQARHPTTGGDAHAEKTELDALLDGLPDRDREVLDFERQWWKYAGAKEQAVREKFDMSSTRYYQVLNALIDRPEALAHDPLLVRRLRRLRAARQRARSARRLGFEV